MRPSSREEFKSYCLRSLGAPTIKIDVTDEQVDDRVDEALNYFTDYHYLGTFRQYYKVQITQEMRDNGYVQLPENIIGAVKIFPLSSGLNTGNMFSVTYQFALNDLYTLTSVSLVPYYMSMQHVALLEQILVGETPLRYNRNRNRLHIDTNWDKLPIGSWIVVDAYEVVNPEEFTRTWADRWLTRYTTALIKRQWGNNLKKFKGVALPGGVTLNGGEIFSEAEEEIRDLERKMHTEVAEMPTHFIG